MAVDTDDCFVGFNAVPLADGLQLYSPGYDAGSEENNGLCESIPGPAAVCDGLPREGGPSGNGKGSIHVEGDLVSATYDWRNPMLQVTVREV